MRNLKFTLSGIDLLVLVCTSGLAFTQQDDPCADIFSADFPSTSKFIEINDHPGQ